VEGGRVLVLVVVHHLLYEAISILVLQKKVVAKSYRGPPLPC
jgi:hypothetical protein